MTSRLPIAMPAPPPPTAATLQNRARNLFPPYAVRHEVAHLIAARYCRGWVGEIVIDPPWRARRPGGGASIQMAGPNWEDQAFCLLVGYAWEQRYGDPARAAQDFRDAQAYRGFEGSTFEELLEEAEAFVDRDEFQQLVEGVADYILDRLPQSGKPSKRTMKWLMDEILKPPVPGFCRAELRAAKNNVVGDSQK